jgi:hypothetical protein
MRQYINAVEPLNEMIVHRSRFPRYPGDRETVIAVNPSKAEWNARFPQGAAGVLCADGTLVIGDGPVLSHESIMNLAGVPTEMEKYRLQICRNRAWAEVWMGDYSAGKPDAPPEAEVRAAVIQHYGDSIEEIEAKLRTALHRFMGAIPVKAIPLDEYQDCMIPGDDDFRGCD